MKNLYLIFLLAGSSCFGQTGMVFNNNPWLVMNNGVYLVIDNPNASGITTAGTGGNIICENEFNIIKWNIGTSTGTYVIPYTTFSGVKIPLTISITTGGTGSGNLQISTYGGPTWNNFTYMPTGVTNMTNMAAVNNSSEVIDRFWMIDPQGYTTKPSGVMQFNYDDAEHLAAGNTITESDLRAERYEDASDNWEIYPVGGVANTVANYVSGVPFNSSDFMRTWTLIDQTTHLLPIVLVSFESECMLNSAILTWQTAQEINTDYFVIEASNDAVNYSPVATIDAAGTTTSTTNYSYVIGNNSENYYKLVLVDLDGTVTEVGVTAVDCGSSHPENVFAYASGFHQITLQSFGLDEGEYSMELYSLSGQLFMISDIHIDPYFNQFVIDDQRLAGGIYIVRLTGINKGIPFEYNGKVQVVN